MTTRRTVLKSGLAGLGAFYAGSMASSKLWAQDGDNSDNTWESGGGNDIVVHPVNHASLVLELPSLVVYADPVGGAERYADLPPPNLILVTHEHGDHFDAETLSGLLAEGTELITNEAVFGMLPADLRERAVALGNGGDSDSDLMRLQAIPAYNLTADRLNFHPEGRDNGYVLNVDDSRIYIAGDTEAIPEMRELVDIDIAFVPMNLPYTMGVEQAASGVVEFAPKVVYPYHYRGKDEVSDTDQFASLVQEQSDDIEVALRDWYA